MSCLIWVCLSYHSELSIIDPLYWMGYHGAVFRVFTDAFLAFKFEQPTYFLALLILLKILVDVFSHKKEHTKFAE